MSDKPMTFQGIPIRIEDAFDALPEDNDRAFLINNRTMLTIRTSQVAALEAQLAKVRQRRDRWRGRYESAQAVNTPVGFKAVHLRIRAWKEQRDYWRDRWQEERAMRIRTVSVMLTAIATIAAICTLLILVRDA